MGEKVANGIDWVDVVEEGGGVAAEGWTEVNNVYYLYLLQHSNTGQPRLDEIGK